METWIQWITKAPPGALPKEHQPQQTHCMRAGATKGLFSPGSERVPLRAPHQPSTGDLARGLDKQPTGCAPSKGATPHCGRPSPHQGQPPLSIYRGQCPIAKGSSARIERQVGAADRNGLQGANTRNSLGYCEYLQRRRPPETADVHGAVICAEDTKGAAQTRKPDEQSLMACPPGLTADTTVFAIGRDAEMKVRMARRQGIASRGLP
jgi:hypothetical protein